MAIRYIRSTWWGLRRSSEHVEPGERRYTLSEISLVTRPGTRIARQVSFPDENTAQFYWTGVDGIAGTSIRVRRDQINPQDLRVHRDTFQEVTGFRSEKFMWVPGEKER